MKIIPGIDIIANKAVRLEKGDYGKVTEYSSDPVNVARAFREAGASELHVVDLDGAKTGSLENLDIISRIIRESGMNVEVGGGIRTEERINIYLEAGAVRVIIGTAAAENIAFARDMAEKYGDALAVGVDVKNGAVATRGWLSDTGENGVDFCGRLASIGVRHVIYTDISKDGMLSGTNLEVYRTLSMINELKITASGGITSVDEIKSLREMGIWGAILGKALYAGRIDLKEALKLGGGE
ncbi:MAG: 1-(5-phosphoribosyl)-5-[(5-phosphoribosylamino)methylideneamino]imidazole-4-carboxamide isomerase [Eubacteriales bacterium]|nr:1-(5-phosphoribosyl)-5-[(5-phosphoribosylamino)methylideneamino]imidazole-4-carboxamide isomerase [Eubacteriales bacterium]